MNVREKYSAYRKEAKDGDIILWRGHSLMARLIRVFDDSYINENGQKIKDKAYYTHASIVYWGRGDRLHNADSWYNGITVVPASHRLDIYSDFCVLRPKMDHVISPAEQIEHGLDFALEQWKANVPYDYFLLPRVALVKKTGIDLTGLGKKSRFICSEFTQEFTLKLSIEDYYRKELFTPQDHIRHLGDGFELLFDNKIRK